MSTPTIAPASAAEASAAIVIFSLALGGFAIGTTEFASMALLPYFAPELGVSEAQAAQAISAYALGVVIGAPLLAVLGARLPRRRFLVWLMLAFAVFNTASGLAHNFGTMLVFRFLSGLPHGAYFGVGALMAASVVSPKKRTQAVAMLMVGLTVATTLGVPLANFLGQTIGWRWGFALVGVLSLITAAAVHIFAPRGTGTAGGNALSQLSALKNRQVLLTLATAAIGFGGFFAVYTYFTLTAMEVTHVPEAVVPGLLMIFGLGMTVGTILLGWAADRNQTLSIYGIMGANVLALLCYPMATGAGWSMALVGFCIGMTSSTGTAIQARLMDVAGDAQELAAALNHSAFNTANAIGPAVAAAALTLGWGLPATGYAGALLTAIGIVLFTITVLDAKRNGTGPT
ncbi:MFS transporter [Pseudooceanicola sp. 502str34]